MNDTRPIQSSMKTVIQEEMTGCTIASDAALFNLTYNQTKQIANDMEIYTGDFTLWSKTKPLRKSLSTLVEQRRR